MYRKTIFAGASTLALLLGGATVASAQDITNATIADLVTGNTVLGDIGQNRANDVTDSYDNGSGIAHVQQNNGSQNAISAASAVDANINSNNALNSTASVISATLGNFQDSRFATRTNLVDDSFDDYAGVATVQQNNGDHNTIGAATAVHSRLDEFLDFGDVTQNVVVSGTTAGQTGDLGFVPGFGVTNDVTDRDSNRDNTVLDSFTDASGIATVQQNNGNANAIGAATAVAADVGGVNPDDDVLQNVTVFGQLGENAPVVDVKSDRDNLIDNSFNGYDGIANVQQNNGDVNVMGIGNAVNANIDLDQNIQENDATQTVNVSGTVAGAFSADVDREINDVMRGQRNNDIDNSFDGASGIANVQQNNGSQNVMGIGNAVQANLDSQVNSLGVNDTSTQVTNTVGGTVSNSSASWGYGLTPTDPVADNMRRNLIDGSFDGYSGLANVQQNNGDNNVTATALPIPITLLSPLFC